MSTSPWFSITALAGKPAELRIFGEIGFEVTADTLIAQLDLLSDTALDVRINSVGGSVIEGMHIYNRLRMHRAPVEVTIEGIAASMATIIACAGKPVRMMDAGWYMVHDPSGVSFGNAGAMRKASEVLDKFGQQLVDIYVQRTGKDREEIEALMAAETWLSPAEALEHGFIDEVLVIDDALQAAASLNQHDLSKFKNPPRYNMPDTAIAAAEARGRQLEVDRRTEITALFTGYSQQFDLTTARDACLSDPTCSVDAARVKLLDAIKAQNDRDVTPHRSVWSPRNRAETPADFQAAASDALAMRYGVKVKSPHPAARDLTRMSLMQMAEASLRHAGVSTQGMNAQRIVALAMSHTTSDFPFLLENTLGKALLDAYQTEPDTAAGWVRSAEVKDFKQQSRVRLGEAPSLELVPEAGEYTEGSFPESREVYSIATYGRLFTLTRQAIINDDLQGFTDLVSAFGAAGRRKELDLVFAILTGNPTMADGTALFHADHDNLASSGVALSVTSLGAARAAMRKQTGIGGVQTLNLQPAYLIVPAALETLAEQLLSSLVDPSKSNDTANPASIRGLTLVSDARLDAASATAWYLATAASNHPAIERGFLNGAGSVYLEMQEGFTVDGTAWKARLDVGVKALDWRSIYKNPGA